MVNEKSKQLEVGKGTEKFIAKTLKGAGYWVYNMPMKVNGQPCDLVAIKGGNRTITWLIDAKHVREDEVSFSFERVEPNQASSMSYALNYAKIQNLGFAIFFDRTKSLYWFPFQDFLKYSQLGYKSVNMNELEEFEKVLKDADNY